MGTDSSDQNHRDVFQSHSCSSTGMDRNSPHWRLFTVFIIRPYCTFRTQVLDWVCLHFISVQWSVLNPSLGFLPPKDITHTKIYFLPSPFCLPDILITSVPPNYCYRWCGCIKIICHLGGRLVSLLSFLNHIIIMGTFKYFYFMAGKPQSKEKHWNQAEMGVGIKSKGNRKRK